MYLGQMFAVLDADPNMMISLQPQVITSLPSPQTKTIQNLEKCSTLAELKQVHSQFIRLGLSSNNFVAGRIMRLCSRFGSGGVDHARKLFDEMPHPDIFIYNTLMKAYLQCQLPRECIQLYMEMLLDSAVVVPNSFTFPCLIRACSDGNQVRQVHAHVLKYGFGDDGFSLNNLIYMYLSFELIADARRAFDGMPKRNDVSWTTLINGYSQLGLVDDAYEAFASVVVVGERISSASWNAMLSALVKHKRFQQAFELFDRFLECENVEIMDRYVATTMLTACSGLGVLESGEWIHRYIKKSGMEVDAKLAAAIIDMYGKCGCLEKAVEVFNELPSRVRGISSWNCMIGGLAVHGKGKAAIELFKKMEEEEEGVFPDETTFINLLNACSHSGLIEEGRYYLKYMTDRYDMEPKLEHFGCMASLLGRAGLFEEARKVIEKMPMAADASVVGGVVGAYSSSSSKIHGHGDDIITSNGKQAIDLDPDNSGRYVILANIYSGAGRWEDAGRVRRLMDERGVKKVAGYSRIVLGGIVNEFVSEERWRHPEYGKLRRMMMGYDDSDPAAYLADDMMSDREAN